MSNPSYRPDLAGDWDDDDGEVISDLVTTEAAPPNPADAPEATFVVIPPPSPEPKKPTRLLSGTFTLDPVNNPSPAIVVPQDVDRKSLTVRVISDNPQDFILLGEEPNRVATPQLAHRLQSGGSQGFDDHLGALWAALPPQANLAGPSADGSSLAGWTVGANGALSLVPAPWDPNRQAVQLTAAAAGAFSLRSPVAPSAFMRSGQNVTVRVKVQSSLTSTISASVNRPGSSVVYGPTASGGAGTAGWRELILTGPVGVDAQGNLMVQVQMTAAAAGDTLMVGDVVFLDRVPQGPTTVSWFVVTA